VIDIEKLFFIFPGGTGGMFVKAIFYYYLKQLGLYKGQITLSGINVQTGDCHSYHYLNLFNGHFPEDVVRIRNTYPDSTIIYIKFDKDDIPLIVRLMYDKHFKSWIDENPEQAINQWPELENNLLSAESKETAFFSNLVTKIDTMWETIDLADVDLVLDFKTVIGKDEKDLHQIIVDYLKTTRRPEVDIFINRYRFINEKYYCSR
jgi:hypothetical protein